MKFSKLTLAIATTIGASASFSAFAIDLYVDTKTKQIYAEPGRGRVLMGAFERVEDKPAAAPADAAEISRCSPRFGNENQRNQGPSRAHGGS